MKAGRLGVGSALAGGVLGVAAMVGVGIGVHQYSANAQTPPATATPGPKQQAETDYLTKLAANLGVSVDQLKAANVTTLNQLIDAAQAAGKITADQATQAKQRIATDGGAHLGAFGGAFGGPGAGGPRRGPGGPGAAPNGKGVPGNQGGPQGAMRGGPAGNILGTVAGVIGIDQQTLMQELRSGKSLAQIGQEHGKSRDDLKAALTGQFGTQLDSLLDRTFQPHTPKGVTPPAATPTPNS